ncbi:sulfite exporter TauE/SafE family protein [Ulvibacter sp.]|nr:sulfite exporter TauE/SafE family protein [Ulvibacter sp.]
MDLLELLGFFGAFIMGVVLGLVGGGGSILTVPVFVYLMSITPVTATAYSLFVVGSASFVGAFQNMKKGLVDYRTAIVFATPALVAVYVTRKFIVPAIPENLFSVGDFTLTKDVGLMLFFAILMLVVSFSMIRSNSKENVEGGIVQYNYPLIIIEGLLIGVFTGLIGAGGGFLIIPALVILAKLPMKKAVATSLLIIAIKSLIGFIGDVENMEIDWPFLLFFTGISIVGILVGTWLSKFIKGKNLKKGFGWFVLLMGIYIIIREFSA